MCCPSFPEKSRLKNPRIDDEDCLGCLSDLAKDSRSPGPDPGQLWLIVSGQVLIMTKPHFSMHSLFRVFFSAVSAILAEDMDGVSGVNMLVFRNIINDKFWTVVCDMTGIVSSASVTMDTSVKMNEIPE